MTLPIGFLAEPEADRSGRVNCKLIQLVYGLDRMILPFCAGRCVLMPTIIKPDLAFTCQHSQILNIVNGRCTRFFFDYGDRLADLCRHTFSSFVIAAARLAIRLFSTSAGRSRLLRRF